MADATTWISLAGNVLTLGGGLFVTARAIIAFLKKKVSEPIERLEQALSRTSTIAEQALDEARRANSRLDTHLEGSNANA